MYTLHTIYWTRMYTLHTVQCIIHADTIYCVLHLHEHTAYRTGTHYILSVPPTCSHCILYKIQHIFPLHNVYSPYMFTLHAVQGTTHVNITYCKRQYLCTYYILYICTRHNKQWRQWRCLCDCPSPSYVWPSEGQFSPVPSWNRRWLQCTKYSIH